MDLTIDYIQTELSKLINPTAVGLQKSALQLYKDAPSDNESFYNLCDSLIRSGSWPCFVAVTTWIKKRAPAIDIKYWSFVKSWVEDCLENWGMVDQFCYRILNPFVEKYPQTYCQMQCWAESQNPNVRRASLVAFIRSCQSLLVYYDYEKVISQVEKLKNDDDYYVKKAVGWVLKCCYKNYPVQLVEYLTRNAKSLDRMIFRYALEKMPKELKANLMAL